MSSTKVSKLAASAAVVALIALALPAGATVTPTDFSHHCDVSLSAATAAALGGNTYSNFPVLLRLPATVSAVFQQGDASDMLIQDQNGTALPYDVENTSTSGVTYAWVKIPELSAGTQLTLNFGGATNPDNAPASVWADYAGVWHFAPSDAGATTIPDASGNSLDGATAGTVSAYDGPFGNVALTSTAQIDAPDYDSKLASAAQFSASGWFKAPGYAGGNGNYHSFVHKKVGLSWNSGNGWYMEMNQSKTRINLVLNDSNNIDNVPDATQNWNYFHLTSDGATLNLYLNGSTTPAKTKTYAIKASGTSFRICPGAGCSDEYRIRKGAVSAEWAALEYQTMADAGFFTYGTVAENDSTAPKIGAPAFSFDENGAVTVTATITANAPVSGSVKCVLGGIEYTMATTDIALPLTYSVTISNLAANASLACSVKAQSAGGTTVSKPVDGGFLNAAVEAEATADADEKGPRPGTFTVSRGTGDTTLPVIVNLSWSGTAQAGVNFENNLPASVTIPAGQSSVTITVSPLVDLGTEEDTTLVLTVAAGAYAGGATATMSILALAADPGFNTWIAGASGLASVGSNWSQGVPQAGQNILFDAQFSNADCEWDGGVNGLTDTVASWTQSTNYTGTVTFRTMYPEVSDTFNVFTIAGDCELRAGSWTHPSNTTGNVQSYRLRVNVGGSLEVAAAARIDLFQRGLPVESFRAGSARGIHGGSRNDFSHVYGDVYEPYYVGNGGLVTGSGTRSPGGGALWLEVAGDAVIDGTVTVRAWADSNNGWNGPASGAPGSIYIRAASLSGSGKLDASATDYDRGASGAPSGGRIAIVLTSAAALGLPTANISALGALSGNGAGCGTIFVKTADQANGTLLLRNRPRSIANTCGILPHNLYAVTPIPAGETWAFDSIVLQNHGVLAVPEGATLVLPNGFASVSGNSNLAGARDVARSGILYLGGTITASDAQSATIQSNWVFQAQAPYSFPGDVTVKDGAAIGDLYFASSTSRWSKCEVSVGGDLTVEPTGWIYARNSGITQSSSGYADAYQYLGGCYSHAGAIAAKAGQNVAYGSAFAPATPGTFGYGDDTATMSPAGGVVKLTMAGALALDGMADASSESWTGVYDSKAGGSGGSLDITCATLSGTGKIAANGATNYLGATAGTYGAKGFRACGAGGRVAVRLTGRNASFDAFGPSGIQAFGASSANTACSAMFAGAGTVYLQDGNQAEGRGTIYVRNDGCADNLAETAIPSAKLGDSADAFKNASLDVSGCAHILAGENLKLRKITLEEGSTINLAGKAWQAGTLKVGGYSVGPGTYTAATAPALLAPYITDSSEDATGTLRVYGDATVIAIR